MYKYIQQNELFNSLTNVNGSTPRQSNVTHWNVRKCQTKPSNKRRNVLSAI